MIAVQRNIYLVLFILFSQTINAASKQLPGYIITNNGDTIRCLIDYDDWYKNPETIQVAINNEKKSFGAADIKGFGVSGYADYTSAAITYHLNPIKSADLPDKFLDSTTTKRVFLKLTVDGPYRLYELLSTERIYYFIQKDNGTISELVYRAANQNGELKEDRQYVNFLAGIFLEEGILDTYKSRVYSASYSSDISSLVKLLNKTRGVTKTVTRPTGHFRIDLFGGGLINFFSSNMTGQFPSYGNLSSSASISGGVNFQYVTGGHFGALKLGLSLGYDHYSSTGPKVDSIVDKADLNAWFATTYTENLSVSNTMVLANFYATYTFNPAARAQFYLKAGFSYGIGKKDVYVVNEWKSSTVGSNSGTVISENKQGTEKVVAISTGLPNPNFGAGIETGRHKFEIVYFYPLQASSEKSQSLRIGMAGVYYYFTLLK